MGWRLAGDPCCSGAQGPPGPPGPPGPGGGTGTVALVNDQGATIFGGSPVYLSSAGKVKLARANADATTHVIGFVATIGIVAGGSGLIQTTGVLQRTTGEWDFVTGEVGGLVAGRRYWLSDIAAGKLIDGGAADVNAPSASGAFDALCLEALSPTLASLLIPVQAIGPIP